LTSTQNFDTVEDSTFSSFAIGDLFDEINEKLANVMSEEGDRSLYSVISYARNMSSS